MSQAQKAHDLMDKAEKKLGSWSLFGGNKYEDAAELFTKAANLFKVSKECARAPAARAPRRDAHKRLGAPLRRGRRRRGVRANRAMPSEAEQPARGRDGLLGRR